MPMELAREIKKLGCTQKRLLAIRHKKPCYPHF